MEYCIYVSGGKNRFGGYIYPSDFVTDYDGSRNIADRIFSDWRFDESCRKNIAKRERMKNYAAN